MDDLNSKLSKEKEANISLHKQVDELKRQLNRKEVELGRKNMELKQKVINSPQASSNGRPEPKVR